MSRRVIVGSTRAQLVPPPGMPADPLSVRAIANARGYPPDFSLTALLNDLSPAVRRLQGNLMHAGDIWGTATWDIASNGLYRLAFSGRDDGTYFGDQFSLGATLDASRDGQTVADVVKGDFAAGEHGGEQTVAAAPWIVDNWDLVQGSGCHFHLEVGWNITVGKVLLLYFTSGLAAVPSILDPDHKGAFSGEPDGSSGYTPWGNGDSWTGPN